MSGAKCEMLKNDVNCFYKSIMLSLKQTTTRNSNEKFIPTPG